MDNNFFYTSTLKLIQSKIFFATSNIPELIPEIAKQFSDNLGLTFARQKEQEGNVCLANSDEVRSDFKEIFTSIDVFNYIYSICYSSAYLEKHKEFSKANFQNIPIPTDRIKFWKLVQLGKELRQIHLLETDSVQIQYPINGDNIVRKPKFEILSKKTLDPTLLPEGNTVKSNLGSIYINEKQYFDNVPEAAWNFYMDNFQPAQKWLEDRKGIKIDPTAILHYQKLIGILTETIGIVNQIDLIVLGDSSFYLL